MQYSPKRPNRLPQLPGIYIFKDVSGSILYIGKAKNLKRRVSSYFQTSDLSDKTKLFVPLISSIDIILVQSEFEALLLEARLIKTNLPKYNVIWKDDKHYIYVNITKEEYPRVLVARKEEKKEGDFFGPFPSGSTVRSMLRYIRTIFPYCTQSPHGKGACFYTHIGLCNPCPGFIRQVAGNLTLTHDMLILKRAYRKNIHNVRMLLSGKHARVEKELEKEMNQYAKEEQFEKAGQIRNRLHQIRYLIQDFHSADSYLENPNLSHDIRKKELEELTEVLRPYFPKKHTISPKRPPIEYKNFFRVIECYDVSNISGTLAVGSLVTFEDGEPQKNRYRRFRIRKKDTPDDFAMLSEVLGRRLVHAEWKLPDLLLIDGGAPQLRAVGKILKECRVRIPYAGLAKDFEELVIPVGNHSSLKKEFLKLKFSADSPALHLLQRLRNEAHRFAHRYHERLRLKALFSP